MRNYFQLKMVVINKRKLVYFNSFKIINDGKSALW